MTLKRFKRTYGGLPEMVDSGEEESARRIHNALQGFTSTLSNLAVDEIGRIKLKEAKQQALAYDPTEGAPELREGGRASDTYNQIVTKAYSDNVYNESLVNLETIAEKHRSNPSGYLAEAEVYRNNLINNAGELTGVATNVFDGLSAKYEAEIRKGLMTKSVEAAIQQEDLSFSNTRAEILTNIESADFDEIRVERLYKGYEGQVNSSFIYNDLQKQNNLQDFKKEIYLASHSQIVRSHLDSGDVKKAITYINNIAKKQKTDGKLSDIYKGSGLTPVEVADHLESFVDDYKEDLATQLSIDNDTRSIEENRTKDAERTALFDLISLGNNITVNDVEKNKKLLSEANYKNFLQIAKGQTRPQIDGLANDLFTQIVDVLSKPTEIYEEGGVTKDKSTEIRSLMEDVEKLYLNGQITHQRYTTFQQLDDNYRFAPGSNLFVASADAIKVSQSPFLLYMNSQAETKFNQWKMTNPDALPEQSDKMAKQFISEFPQLNDFLNNIQTASEQAL